MAALDIVILAILLWGGYHGYKTGFTMALVSILAFILAVIGGFKLLHYGMDLLDDHFEISGKLLPFISFLIIFIAIVLIVNLLGKSLKTVLDMTLLGSVDKAAGGLLGVLKWAFGLSILLWLCSSFLITIPENWTEHSFLFPILNGMAPVIAQGMGKIFPFFEGLFDTIKQMLEGSEGVKT